MADAKEEISGTELAKRLRKTKATVSRWKDEGCPFRLRDGVPVYVQADVVDWLIEKAAARAAPADKDAEVLRKLSAEADLREIEVAKARGELVPLTAYDEALAEQASRWRAELVSMASKDADFIAETYGLPLRQAAKLAADLSNRLLSRLQRQDDDAA